MDMLRYIKGSFGRVLVYGGVRDSSRTTAIEGFVESDYASYLDQWKYLCSQLLALQLVGKLAFKR